MFVVLTITEHELFDRYLDSCINMNNTIAELAESQKRHLEAVAELKRKQLEIDLMWLNCKRKHCHWKLSSDK